MKFNKNEYINGFKYIYIIFPPKFMSGKQLDYIKVT